MDDCIFCKIVNKEVPTEFLYENDNCVLFLDINPSSKGHSLLVTKKHFINIADIPKDDFIRLSSSLKEVATKLLLEYDGLNIRQNNGKVAEQLVEHLHFHLMPREKNDNLNLASHQLIKISKKEMKEIGEQIKKLFKG